VALRIIIAVWATTPLVSVHNHNRRTVLCYCRRSRFVMGGVQSLSPDLLTQNWFRIILKILLPTSGSKILLRS
jgi:hypothetical protein